MGLACGTKKLKRREPNSSTLSRKHSSFLRLLSTSAFSLFFWKNLRIPTFPFFFLGCGSEHVTEVELQRMKERKIVCLKDKASQQSDKFTFTDIFDQNEKSKLSLVEEEKQKICDPLVDLFTKYFNIALISIQNKSYKKSVNFSI